MSSVMQSFTDTFLDRLEPADDPTSTYLIGSRDRFIRKVLAGAMQRLPSEFMSDLRASLLWVPENETVTLGRVWLIPTLRPDPADAGRPARDVAPLQVPIVDTINEVIANYDCQDRLRQLWRTGETGIVNRIHMLFDPGSYFEGDEALSVEAALGFLDFIDRVDWEGSTLEISSTSGRLCSEWRAPEGRIAVIWFNDRETTSLTVIDADGTLQKDLRADTATTAALLLADQGFFSLRRAGA